MPTYPTEFNLPQDNEHRVRVSAGTEVLTLTQNTPPTATMLQQARSVPVIFVIVADPDGSG